MKFIENAVILYIASCLNAIFFQKPITLAMF